MFFIVYAFKGQVHVFAGQVKIVSHLSCRTSAILKYFCLLQFVAHSLICTFDVDVPFDTFSQLMAHSLTQNLTPIIYTKPPPPTPITLKLAKNEVIICIIT